jgi:histidinol dehydrogenase
MVFGTVGIDMIAGPSEILVMCDGETDPDWIAMDLFSQAEHDEDAQAMLVSPDWASWIASPNAWTCCSPRCRVRRLSEPPYGARRPDPRRRHGRGGGGGQSHRPRAPGVVGGRSRALASRIRHAGAIFMGRYTAEAVGDYCAGPNHVLPTSRTARFSSPLGVYDFQKRSSLINCSAEGAATLGRTASRTRPGRGSGGPCPVGGIPDQVGRRS